MNKLYQAIRRTDIVERVKNERNLIIQDTRHETGTVKNIIETRKKLKNSEVTDRAISGIEKANQFKYINTELNKAFTKDLQGHFIE